MTNKYKIWFSLEEGKIYINRNEPGTEERTVQIFSSKKEFPFLYASKLNLSSDYDVWVAPGSKEEVPSWKEGFGVRILDSHKIEQETLFSTEPESDKTRVLFITPHLSTGGCPQYLVKKLETYKDVLDAYVVEHDFLSSTYVVQRNRVIDLVGEKFFSLGDKKEEILEIIEKVKPEIIHFEEIPESYMSMEIIDKIYSPARNYFITETTHSSASKPSMKRFLPDKFIFCSRYSQDSFKSMEIPSEIWEYPIENLKRGSRSRALEELDLDPSYVHVLNVGLFTPGKNQGEIFEIAKKFEGERVMFHFVGNQAGNFEHYWRPLMMNKPTNCKVWGERSDVDKFMKACDIFYFSSTYELNPLVVKEALSWKMPVLMYNLSTYMGAYDGKENVTFLNANRDIKANEKILRNHIESVQAELKDWLPRTKVVHIVSDIFSEIEQTSIKSVSSLAEVNSNIEYTVHYNPPAKEIPRDKTPLFKNDNLRPGHFGCFEAFRKAIEEDFTDDYDYLVVCERDCILEAEPVEVVEFLRRTYDLMKREDVTYFSFGDTVDLDNCYLQSEKVADLPGGFSYQTNKIIGLQFIIFNRKGREFLKEQFATKGWYGMDIWLTEVYNMGQMKMGILNKRITTQLDGFSIIDQTQKTFKGNKK
jgi:hypothetical protein